MLEVPDRTFLGYMDDARDGQRRADYQLDSAGSNNGSCLNLYYLPYKGISIEVITADIRRYLGNDATVQSGRHPDGRPGYLIDAYRALTPAEISQLKRDSLIHEAEIRRSATTATAHKSYYDPSRLQEERGPRPTFTSRAMSDQEAYTRSESGYEPAFATQKVEVWSEAKDKRIATVACLDTGTTGRDANLVSVHFLQILQIGPANYKPAPSRLDGLGGPIPILGRLELTVYPIKPDENGKDRIHTPLPLNFYVCDGGTNFGHLLLGKSYCEDHRPVFRWSHLTKRTDEQKAADVAENQRRDAERRRVAESNTRPSSTGHTTTATDQNGYRGQGGAVTQTQPVRSPYR